MKSNLLSPGQPARYTIRLSGQVHADWSDWLTNPTIQLDDQGTQITGTVCDQAALFGLLSFIRDLGAPLLMVIYLPNPERKKP